MEYPSDVPKDRKKLLEMAERNKAPEAIKEMIRRMPDRESEDAAASAGEKT
ncbi:MAG: DUF2795 domain-containing protein [Methanomicrobiales archaeon]|nr:DUF2795 domain-containing protein [Methanomicrobiales archaeon]MDI6876237.1 DUF2795 domain-containing protein [Methanomicrobiales archaeon]